MIPIPTMEWTGGSLKLLDQRELPEREVFLECADTSVLADAITTLAVRGAPAIGIAAAYGAVIAAIEIPSNEDFRSGFMDRLHLLECTRPTAVNLFHCLDIQREVFSRHQSRKGVIEALLESANRLFEEDLSASRLMGEFGADLLDDDCTLLTHCNAGGLATSGLGTALAVIYEAWDRGILREVYADETRPLLQGARLTSWELTRAGIPTTVLPDSAAASLLRTDSVDAVIVGSDRIAANGDVANKIGTYPLALAARTHDVPFYVVAPVSTFDFQAASGREIVIEQRSREELASCGGRQLLPLKADTWNPAFDITPATLVTAIICEKGVLNPPYDESFQVLERNSGATDAPSK